MKYQTAEDGEFANFVSDDARYITPTYYLTGSTDLESTRYRFKIYLAMKECPECEICYEDGVMACAIDGTATRLSLPGPRLIANRYLLEKRIGRGAMGQVYLAKDSKFDSKRVAVKTVRPDLLSSIDMQEGEAIARFAREAQAAASIQHPNTVSVLDFGESSEGIFYLVMEYVEGETLHRLLRREGTLPVPRAVRLLRQIADGIDAAHDLGILHRDLKPANIFLMQKGKGGEGFVKVGDFGLAKITNHTVTDAASESMPSSRGIIGTPEFMAPEQMQPALGVDGRADLYSLGTIAYLMLGGKTPFTGELMQLVMQKVMHTPPPLSTLRSDLPSDVERVVMSALETDRNRRPDSVSNWIAKLEKAAQDVDETRVGKSRLIIRAPAGAEVYINDERKGSVGNSGRVVLSDIPVGRHVLRVSQAGSRDDERLIEVREGGSEQVIQAQLRGLRDPASHPSISQGANAVGSPTSSLVPGIVACRTCSARYAEGVRFCGRCGSSDFVRLTSSEEPASGFPCPRCAVSLPANSVFCGRCGLSIRPSGDRVLPGSGPNFASLTEGRDAQQVTRVCTRCGGAFPPHIKFCGRCGLTLS
ncbi:MAG: protein kinase [Pyrinomonadaceae bacterium]